ncbi:Serpentine Receptor, class H [Caenorhabditis elegans]|uniref:Serpentine Receptor, class H n=1 Tax=Caenorhabditis elegans TaxID=6239 RepID=Q7YXA6_CAEEL|nr:Serpentine Receptor, class H [Caenorhabditis elegans]CAE11311.1 Serpentine Receptor, class H [Caenorhabditis elegans]|eukprot:NP_001022472.1 Serpentine Receptor, class H [Caenorhabditis elegans]
MNNCRNVTYKASTDFLESGCHIGSICMFTFSSYTLFLIYKKSSEAMKSSVPYMIHLHLWTMFCDLTWAVIVLPMFFMPVIAAHASGLLLYVTKDPIALMWLPFASTGGMLGAMVNLFEHRHQAIVTNSRFVMRRKWTRRIYYTIFYTQLINFGLPEILTVPDDQVKAKQDAFQKFPCLPPIFFEDTSAVIQENARLFNPHMYIACALLTSMIWFYCSHIAWHLLPKNNPSMSSGTRKMLKNFFISMCIQVAIPTFVVQLPNIYWYISINSEFYSQELNNISIILFTLHGTSSSIATIFIYKPYRVYTKRLLLHKILRLPEPKPISTLASIPNRSVGIATLQ